MNTVCCIQHPMYTHKPSLMLFGRMQEISADLRIDRGNSGCTLFRNSVCSSVADDVLNCSSSCMSLGWTYLPRFQLLKAVRRNPRNAKGTWTAMTSINEDVKNGAPPILALPIGLYCSLAQEPVKVTRNRLVITVDLRWSVSSR